MARPVTALTRAFDILELFLRAPEQSAPEIVNRLSLPRTTVHELLGTLVSRRYLVRVPGQPVRYRLGAQLFQLGSVFAENLDFAREAHAVAVDVAAQCDEAVHVAMLDGNEVVYIARVDSTHPVRMVSALGRHLPAHCTAVGKMLLSGLSDDAFDALYPPAAEPVTMTPNSISSPAHLREVLHKIRAEEIAYDDRESSPDLQCAAAGVYDHTGQMVMAMSVSVPTHRWQLAPPERWAALARSGARALSENLGHVALRT